MPKSLSLTRRQQFWVGHLQSCAERQQLLSSYAAERGLVVGALYKGHA